MANPKSALEVQVLVLRYLGANMTVTHVQICNGQPGMTTRSFPLDLASIATGSCFGRVKHCPSPFG